MNTKHLVHIIVFRVVTLYFHSSSHSTLRPVPEEEFWPGLRRWLLEDPMSGKRTLHYATQAGEASLGYEKIYLTTSSLISNHPTPQIAFPLIIMCELWFSERPTKLYRIPKMNWNQRLQHHLPINKETVRKVCGRFQSHLEAVVISLNKFNFPVF